MRVVCALRVNDGKLLAEHLVEKRRFPAFGAPKIATNPARVFISAVIPRRSFQKRKVPPPFPLHVSNCLCGGWLMPLHMNFDG
jgi:hypothetical protein